MTGNLRLLPLVAWRKKPEDLLIGWLVYQVSTDRNRSEGGRAHVGAGLARDSDGLAGGRRQIRKSRCGGHRQYGHTWGGSVTEQLSHRGYLPEVRRASA